MRTISKSLPLAILDPEIAIDGIFMDELSPPRISFFDIEMFHPQLCHKPFASHSQEIHEFETGYSPTGYSPLPSHDVHCQPMK